ncbi:MAG: response regulator [Cyanobacteria bacterium P01_F01_bin.86]
MLPEQQQRIMGYFIEEAKDHLNTIEQGLLNLQSTIEDADKANEVFRAAHSVKGGAAMLGLESIQKTAHRMEDYFKVLKEAPVQVDRALETMFLRVSDGLKDLLEQLEGPFGLTQDKAQEIMADVEPVFDQLSAHLNTLVETAGGSVNLSGPAHQDGAVGASPDAVKASFKRDVAVLLRQMLTTFKQPDTAESRQALQAVCTQLKAIGDQFELAAWCDLLETARLASAHLENDYRKLAPVLIKEIKKAQDLVLSGRASEVSVCDAMQALLPEDILATESLDELSLSEVFGEAEAETEGGEASAVEGPDAEASDVQSSDVEASDVETPDGLGELFLSDASDGLTVEPVDDLSSLGDSLLESPAATVDDELGGLFESGDEDGLADDADLDDIAALSVDLDFDEIPSELSTLNRHVDSDARADESMDALLATVNVTGPDVGTEELNSLADLFDGDLEELDNTLGGHAFVSEEMRLNPEKIDLSEEDDLTDLLVSEAVDETPQETTVDEFDEDLFGGTLSDGEFAIADDGPDSSSEGSSSSEGGGADDFSLGLDEPSDKVPLASPLSTDMALDMAELSEDVWSDDVGGEGAGENKTEHDHSDSDDELFGDGGLFETDDVANLVSASLSDGLVDDLPIDDLPIDEVDLTVPDLQPSVLEDVPDALLKDLPEDSSEDFGASSQNVPDGLGVDDSLDDGQSLDNLGLGLDDSLLDNATSNRSGPAIPDLIVDEAGDLDNDDDVVLPNSLDVSVEDEAIAHDASADIPTTDAQPAVVLKAVSVSPVKKNHTVERDIEFPTLTGTKLQEAEESIDNFFLDEPPTQENSSTSSGIDSILDMDDLGVSPEVDAENSSDVQLIDAPWDELADDETLSEEDRGNESFDLDWLGDEAKASTDTSTTDTSTTVSAENALEEATQNVESSSPLGVDLAAAEAGSGLEALLDPAPDALGVEATHEATQADEKIDDLGLWAHMTMPSEASSSEASEELSNSSLDLGLPVEQAIDSDESFLDLESDLDVSASLNAESYLDAGADLRAGDGLDSSTELDFDADLFAEVGEDNSGLSLESDEAQINLTASSSVKDAALQTSAVQSPGVEAIPEDVLAEFETAFGETVAEDDGLLDGLLADENDEFLTSNDELNVNELGSREVPKAVGDEDLLEFSTVVADEALLEGDSNEYADTVTDSDDVLFSNASEHDDGLSEFELSSEVSEEENLAEAFDDDFDDLDALLAEDSASEDGISEDKDSEDTLATGDLPTFVGDEETAATLSESVADDEDFGDLERLLEEGDADAAPAVAPRRTPQRVARRSNARDQNMRVSVKHLDTLSNLVGELVVSRNTLERDQERLRQFLDNLLFQVQQLNDVGQRMRDLYERSLLESSLMSNRRAHSMTGGHGEPTALDDMADHATGETFDALEMDRFTGFHTLSQEMIELIVRVRESSSDIGYTVESSDQVTRQFRQITTQLQEGLNTARMVAFSQAADRLPRAVRDISLKCGKEARLIVEGQDTLIDKMIVEHLYDPLTHLVNNAITHGIETPDTREAAGKPPEGSITVRAFYQGNQTVIYVADDGGGINTDFVKRKAIEKNLISQAEADELSDIQTYDLLFHPGFSTRDQADDFAGRGVGMDVVRTSLAEIRGSVTIDSELGTGTSFTIRLPLTLSISKALSCVSNQARIAFPMDGVEDMLDVPRDRVIQNEQGQECVRWRDKVLSFQPVTDLLKFNRTLGRGRVYGGSQDDDVLSVIVLRNANTFVAVQVDQVIGEQEIVIKQLEGPVPKPLGIAGATVLGDGRVMPIADVLELIDIATGRVRRDKTSMMWADAAAAAAEEAPVKNDPTVLIVDDSITVRELLSMSFNKVGYRVEQARDGQEAWDKLRSGLPCDLVFCDIEMPRMDGLELLSRMQKDNHLNRIPIAMLTSRGADRHRQMAVDLGASGYFTKPYLEEALLDAAQRMLNGETLAKGRGG